MPILSDGILYSVVRQEHLPHSDFFLRWLSFPEEPQQLTFTCLSGGRELCRVSYGSAEIAARLAYGREELPRYRASSLRRILGLSHCPPNAFLHEYFSLYASQPVDSLLVEAVCGGELSQKRIRVVPYQSPNRYRFPLKGTFLVTDTYPALNSHRWCRNSEFALDVGAFDGTLRQVQIAGAPVFAACAGVVEQAFDGLEDTTEDTDLDALERQMGESPRIDGNHVLLRHPHGELSLYAHLGKGSVAVRPGQAVEAGQLLGWVGSSGSSWIPHLHFHVMLDGLHGPGVPVAFENLTTILGEPCALEDTVNLVRAE